MTVIHNGKLPLDSRQLRAFATLAKTGSFTQTGKLLFISQSAVSHSLKALESDVGCRLFDRVGKRVHMTPAGEHLLHHAEKILKEMETARSSLDQRSKWGHGRLRLGASATVCQYLLPTVIRDFREEFPDWLIHVEPGDTQRGVELLREGRLDLVLSLAPRKLDPVEFVSLFTDELIFVVAPQHPWVALGRAPREEIRQQNVILYSKTSHTYQLIDQYFQREGIDLNPGIEFGSMDGIKELVKLGLGVGILAPWVVRREITEGSLLAVPLGKRKLKRSWGILRPPEKRQSLADAKFIQYCRTACLQIGIETVRSTSSAIDLASDLPPLGRDPTAEEPENVGADEPV